MGISEEEMGFSSIGLGLDGRNGWMSMDVYE